MGAKKITSLSRVVCVNFSSFIMIIISSILVVVVASFQFTGGTGTACMSSW